MRCAPHLFTAIDTEQKSIAIDTDNSNNNNNNNNNSNSSVPLTTSINTVIDFNVISSQSFH